MNAGSCVEIKGQLSGVSFLLPCRSKFSLAVCAAVRASWLDRQSSSLCLSPHHNRAGITGVYHHACIVCDAGGRNQSILQAKQALYQLSYVFSLLVSLNVLHIHPCNTNDKISFN